MIIYSMKNLKTKRQLQYWYRKFYNLKYKKKYEEDVVEFYKTHKFKTVAVVSPKLSIDFNMIDTFITACEFGDRLTPLLEGQIGKMFGWDISVQKGQKKPIKIRIMEAFKK